MFLKRFLPLALGAALLSACEQGVQSPDVSPVGEGREKLQFSVREGRIDNVFYRQGPVAAHMLLTSGPKPRLIVAFPAGNSGVSLWMKRGEAATEWRYGEDIRPIQMNFADGDALYGIETEIEAATDTLDIEKAVLGNVRHLRNYLHDAPIPADLNIRAEVADRTVVWQRERRDGIGGYYLSLHVLAGDVVEENGHIRFKAPSDGALRLKLRALSGDKPLTPIEMKDVLRVPANDELAAQMLAFLTYEEKMLAGSWRFLTYFGRDTLLSLRLLLPALSAQTMEAGIGSVLERLNENGEVAHEEDIAEFAVFRALDAGGEASDKPHYDYHMVDDDYMLMPIVAAYLLKREDGRARADDFLARETRAGESYKSALLRNMAFVMKTAQPFAETPGVRNLIALKPGLPAGEWRDSSEGLAGGRIPYDINAVFVPVALQAIADLQAAGLADGFDEAADYASVWREKAPAFFRTSIPNAKAKAAIETYAKAIEVPATNGLGGQDLDFYALALNGEGEKLKILHSDGAFALLFGEPPAQELDTIVTSMMRPFPSGLLTPVGLLVANPAQVDKDIQDIMTRGHYHGTVVWSWQQAMLAAGIERQLARQDLSTDLKAKLQSAKTALWQAIDAGRELRNSELWSWTYEGGAYQATPFGQGEGHKTESNAAQLWSTVYLALEHP